MCIYSIPEWFHFHFFLYELNVKTNDVSFLTNISATRDSSFTMYTYNRYLTRNLGMPIYHLTSHNLQLRGSNASVSNGASLPYFIRIFVHIVCHWRAIFATWYSVFAKSVIVSVLGNFLVNLKYLYLLWKFLINQQWWNEVIQSREAIYDRKYHVFCYINNNYLILILNVIYLDFILTWLS